MRITDLIVHQRSVPLSIPFVSAKRGVVREAAIVYVELKLEDGTSSWGEVSLPTCSGETAEGITAAINGPLRTAVRGQEVMDLELLLDRIKLALIGNLSAKSAVDIAVHDAHARVLSVPLYRTFGGSAREFETTVTVGGGLAAQMAQRAAEVVKDGCTSLKIKVGQTIGADVERVLAVREAVGPSIRLYLDANQGWTAKTAVTAIHRLEDAGAAPALLEQPLASWDLAGMRFVRERVETPIVADESVGTPQDALNIIRQEAADVLTLKLQKHGGLRPALRVATLAETAGLSCMISCMFESEVSISAAASLASARGIIRYIDLDAPLWLAASPVRGGVQYSGTTLRLSDQPGLGVEGLKGPY
ncbi:dipeptide epimerase [Streptomyces sp. NPDC005336]|uniref:mandelate racemase/muconate lactonizing enzyme family protein n=1 Tax=Streptomyces sp. NPDC005336 TaxID=3157035 RepID=UPI0033AD255F